MIIQSGKPSLDEAMAQNSISKLSNVNIVIRRQSQILMLYSDTTFIKQYTVIFGRNGNSKTKKGDLATPRGSFEICGIDLSQNYYKFIKFNFPNIEYANEAFRNKLISEEVYSNFVEVSTTGECPKNNPAISEPIGIHGFGKLNFIFKYLPFSVNWTNGSIGMSNEDLDELLTCVSKGTKIVIQE